MGTRLALVLAIVMGFIALIGVQSWLQEKEKAIDEIAEPVMFLAAKMRLPKGTVLDEKNIVGVPVQAKYVVSGMIPYNDRARYYGKLIERDLDANKPIFDYALENTTKVSISRAVVNNGMRAVTIGVDQIKGVSGLIKPGDYVDVVGTFAIDDFAQRNSTRNNANNNSPAPAEWKGANDAGRVTKTIFLLQAIRVISIDNRTVEIDYEDARKPASTYRTVTLQVTPDDALRLIDATDKGKIQLILRNPAEGEVLKNYTDPANNQPRLSVDITNEILKTKSK